MDGGVSVGFGGRIREGSERVSFAIQYGLSTSGKTGRWIEWQSGMEMVGERKIVQYRADGGDGVVETIVWEGLVMMFVKREGSD
jgi:hypothetical protein